MQKDKPLYKLTKNEHLNNIFAKLPIITCLYIAQCFLMNAIIKDINIGNYALFLGGVLITFVLGMYSYDRYHHVILCEKHIRVHFELTGSNKYIPYSEIKEIKAYNDEVNYGPISVIKKDGQTIAFHFIDHPKEVHKFLVNFIAERMSDDQDMAA